MYIACLDQNVISALAKGTSPFWRGLKERLISAAERDQIICPIHPATVRETLPCWRETRMAIRDLCMVLSKGLWFKGRFTLLAEETLALLRPLKWFCPVVIANWNDNIADDRMAKEIHQNLAELEAKRQELVRQMPDPVDTEGYSHDDFYQALCVSRAQDFYKQVQAMSSGQRPNPEFNFIDVCHFLEQEKVTTEELEKLKQLIKNRRWSSIRPLFFHTKSGAIREQQESRSGKIKCNPRQYKFNDEYDLSRVAVGLSYCNFIITENPIAADIRQHQIDLLANVKVLGYSEEAGIISTIEELTQ